MGDYWWLPVTMVYLIGYWLLLRAAVNRRSTDGPAKLALANICVIILLLPFCHAPYSYGIAVLAVINVVIAYRLYLAAVLKPGRHARRPVAS